MLRTALFIPHCVLSSGPYGLCRSQLVAGCLDFLFATRVGYEGIYTDLGLLDP